VLLDIKGGKMEKGKNNFYDFIISNPGLLDQSCAYIDLKKLFLISTFRDILSYLMDNIETYDIIGCNIKVKGPYLIIFEREWMKIKRDIKIYQIENENRR